MSTLSNITKAFNKRLATITPNIEIAYEGGSFTPTYGVPYQRVQLSPSRPLNPTLGGNYHREKGTFQIFLCYPSNAGTTTILDRAELTRSYFKRGDSFSEGDSTIIIMGTPFISGTSIVQDRIVLPVLISYSVEVFS